MFWFLICFLNAFLDFPLSVIFPLFCVTRTVTLHVSILGYNWVVEQLRIIPTFDILHLICSYFCFMLISLVSWFVNILKIFLFHSFFCVTRISYSDIVSVLGSGGVGGTLIIIPTPDTYFNLLQFCFVIGFIYKCFLACFFFHSYFFLCHMKSHGDMQTCFLGSW